MSRKTKQLEEVNPFDRVNKSATLGKKFLFLSAFISFILIGHRPLLEYYARWLSPSDSDPSADIAIVVDGNPIRLQEAVNLFKDGKVKYIYINGISSSMLREFLLEHRLPSDKVYWGGCRIATTFDQPIAFKESLDRYKITDHRLVLVTDPYHLRRSLWVYHHILDRISPDFKIKTHPRPDKNIVYDLWWEDKYSRDWVSSETQKLLFYWANYGLLNKTERKDMNDVEYNDFFRQDQTSYNAKSIQDKCGSDPY